MNRRSLGALKRAFEQTTNMVRTSREISLDILRALAESLRCDWATYWQVDPAAQVLRAKVTWRRPGIDSAHLARDTEGRSLSMSEGVAGHVWRSRKPIWTDNIVRDMWLPRSLDASEAGPHGGVWFAVQNKRTVYGVIELLGRDLNPGTREQLLAIQQFGFTLGKIEDTRHSSAVPRSPL